jgi:TatD DNase family protein
VGGFVVIGVGESLQPARDAIALAQRVPGRVAATVGVHPHDASRLAKEAGIDAEESAEFERLAMLAEVVAIGETGLDYHYDHSPRALQRDAFAWQIALARRLGKPLVIHTRTAPQDTLDVLTSENARDVGGIIHCFSEDWAFASSALDLGFVVSFSGIVTFKNAKAIQEVATKVPSDMYLVETDSPYLAPMPHRGKPCEPAFVVHTAKRVAELRGETLEVVAIDSTRNATRVFRRQFGD